MVFRLKRRILWGLLPAVALLLPAGAAADEIVPQTTLHVSVVQWMPNKGRYEAWDALGGNFKVSEQNTVTLPVIGSLSVAHHTTAELADEISHRIQKKIGLISPPDTSVEITDYPPIFIVGDVALPGQYKFREGLTVLQALAIGGGLYRQAGIAARSDVAELVTRVKEEDDSILRSTARIARLKAELAGSAKIDFPALPEDPDERARAKEIFAQEQVIFDARAHGLERQTASLNELKSLLSTEIDVLQKKGGMTDERIKFAEKSLAGVTRLLDKGLTLSSRQAEIEQTIAGYKADRLDNVTATMRARQQITEAERNLRAMQDERHTGIASSLQDAQAKLEATHLKKAGDQKMLMDRLSAAAGTTSVGGAALSFAVVRNTADGPKQISANELTVLLPGDVLKVTNKALPAAGPRPRRHPAAKPAVSDAGKLPDRVASRHAAPGQPAL